MDEDVTKNESKTEQANSEKKGAPILMICALVIIFVFIKWVFPAMEKDTRPPSSILTGEESSNATQ